jgi:GT2 family glycosyltransferase
MTDIINTFVFPIVRNDMILDALVSLHEHTPKNYKVIVVNQTQWHDNDECDWEYDVWSVSDLVIRPRLNYGFAQAANLGTRLATTKYVTIANDDVIFLPDWWDGIMRTFERFNDTDKPPMVVAPMSPKEPGWGWGVPGYVYHCRYCGGRIIDENRRCDCGKNEPLLLEEIQEHPERLKLLESQAGGAMIDGLAMWCVTFDREKWMELGMFDEKFMKGGGEDYDGSARIYQAGHRAIASSYSWVWHHWGKSKDSQDGLNVALPAARTDWNKISTKGFGEEGLWHPDVDCWGNNCERTDKEVWRAPL